MQRAFARDAARSHDRVQSRTIAPARDTTLEVPLWSEVQTVLGNEAASGLRDTGARSGDELYLLDLMRASAVTGHDFHAYLPWRASPSWNTFARAWYRVLWTERDRAGLAPSTAAALDVASPSMGVGVESGAGLDGAGLDGAALDSALDGTFDGAALDGTFDGAALEAALDGAALEAALDGAALDGAALDGGLAVAAAHAARAGAPDVNDPADMDRWYAQLRASSGAGRPLTRDEKDFLREVFGRPAPDARLHEGSVARQASADINARAFTIGDHVWFAESPDLGAASGAELLAHEITHVIQNSLGKGAQQTEAVSSPGQPLEIEAENRGREARRVQPGWRVEAPGAIDAAGRFLVGLIEGQLPETPTSAPPGLVLEGLRQLLAGRAGAWIAEHAARLDELAAGGSRAGVDLARALLSEARAALAAPATPEGLATLARFGGLPSAEDLDVLAATFAPYPDFAARAGAVLAELPATLGAASPGAEATRLGAVVDVDADRAALTRQLVTQLVASLHLPAGSVHVHADADAADKLAGIGARGVAEGANVFLDPAQYDPATADGRALLAHEVVHVAQAGLAPIEPVVGTSAGTLAEAEAHYAADRFAAGAAIQPLAMGLPDGHVAAEGDVSGADLKALLAQYKAQNEQRGGGFVTPPGSNSRPKADGTEDHAKKVEQYEDGVDGIADLIGDLDAFDELCEAIDDEEEQKAATALAKVKGSEPYQQLAQMWQGAKEGGQDEAAMKAAFEAEFHNRGFWGETEEAFRRVRDGAKRDARPSAEAAAAKQDKATADANKKEPAPTEKKADGKGGPNGAAKADGTGVGRGEGAGGDFAGMSVDQMAPTLPGYEELKKVTDDQLAAGIFEKNHQTGLASSVASGQSEYGRTGQILSELGNGFAGSFIKGFTDQAFDTLVLDTLGTLADKGLTAASKGTFKTPFVGPLIGLVMNNPLSSDYWSGLFGSEPGKEGKFVKGWGSFKNAFDWSQFDGLTGWDWVGVFCAKLADFFGGLRDILDGIATLCGTLSAVSYVAGGILIAIGLALVWFAGVGAPLISIGGWLVRAGGILARINTALGFVVNALSALAMVFRTAAAFLVPAELYAEQLAGVGDAASNYGEKVGAKIADNSANALKDRIASGKDPSGSEAAKQDGDGQQKGKDQGDAAVDAIREHNDALDKQRKDLDATLEEQKKATPKGDPDAKKDDADAQKKDGDDPKKESTAKAVAKKMFADTFAPLKGIKETVAGIKEMGSAIRNPRDAAADGALATHKALEDALKKRIDKTRENAADLKTHLDALVKAAEARKDDPEFKALLDKFVGETEADLKRAEKDLAEFDREYQRYLEGRSKTKYADADARKESADRHEDADAAKEKLDAKKKELRDLEKAKNALDETIRQETDDLAAARKQEAADAAAKKKTDADLAREKEHLEGFKKANDAQTEAKRLQDQQEALKREAADLRKQAETVEAKAKLEKDLADIDEKLEYDRALNSLRLKSFDKWVGRRTEVDTGTTRFKGEITKVEVDGVTVDGPNGPVKVPFAQTGDRYLRESGAKLAETEAAIKANEQRYRDTGQSLQYDYANVAPGDAAALRTSADAKVKQADELAPRIEDARKKGTYNGTQDTEAAHKDRAERLELDAKNRQKSAASSATEVQQLEQQIEGHRAERTGKLKEIDDAKKEIATLTRDQGLQTFSDYGETTGKWNKASSANATGGVGSSWKDVFNGLWGYLSKLREISRLKAEGKPVPADLEAPSTSAGDYLQKLTGLQQSSEAEAKAIGERQAMLEELMGLSLTVDITAMMEAREKAVAAAERHAEKHAWAYACYHAEKQVDGLAKETETLAKEGEPVKAISAKQKPGIDKAKQDEEKRGQALGGASGDVKKPDSALTGIVVDLVKNLSKYGDRFDDKPDAGSSDAGATATNAQNEASTQAKDQKKASTGASDEQRAALDQALQLRAKQEGKLGGDIDATKQKAQDELAIKGEIQQLKATALAEREAAAQDAETNAAKFNADYKALSEWATAYKGKREKLTNK